MRQSGRFYAMPCAAWVASTAQYQAKTAGRQGGSVCRHPARSQQPQTSEATSKTTGADMTGELSNPYQIGSLVGCFSGSGEMVVA